MQAPATKQEKVELRALLFACALLHLDAWGSPPGPLGAAVLPPSGRCCSYGIFLKGKSIFSLRGSPVTSTFKNKQRLQHSPARDV